MSISEASFYGGSINITATRVLYEGHERVISCYNTSAIDLTLPDPASVRSNKRGVDWFYVLRHSSGAVNIKRHDGTTLVTLSSNQVARLSLMSTGFVSRVTTLSTPRTAGVGSRPAVANKAPLKTFNPSCFEGSYCDLARSLGNEPLDGEEGRNKVIVPMIEDVTVYAKNSEREPIRAADFICPKIVVLGFEGDPAELFSRDTLHPQGSVILSDGFYEALRNNDRPHGLTYVSTANQTSRHWHHTRYVVSGWNHGNGSSNLTVSRSVWSKISNYLDSTGTTRQLELRFVVEHTLTSMPGVDPKDTPGSIQNRNHGAWGSLYMVYVFTNEILPSFADGNTFTPAGAVSAVVFSKADPCAHGIAFGVGGNSDQKFCHPQLVLAGNLVTTYQSPIGREWVPPIDRKYHRAYKGGFTAPARNREYCYLVSNGAPWTPAGCTDPAPAGVGKEENVVFGWRVTTTSFAGITLGGDFKKSKPYEFITWENGTGVGRTYLKPLKPGWNETCGKLDVVGGSSGGIALCTDDEDGIDDGSGTKVWPKYAWNTCEGHPTEPFEGIGGSHQCFNPKPPVNAPNDTTATCCWSTSDVASARVTDMCRITTNTYGDYTGSSCEILDSECAVGGQYFKQIVLELEDYDYNMNGNQDARAISWSRFLIDPDWTATNLTYTGSGLTDKVGTWSTGSSTLSVTTTNNSVNMKALCAYEPSVSYNWENQTVKAKGLQVTTSSHAVGVRISTSGSSATGYFGVITPTGGTNATVTIKKYVLNVVTVLATTSITNLTSANVDMEIKAWGTDITFKWTVQGQSQAVLSVQDCDISDGWGGYGTETNATTVSFNNVQITDENYQYIESTASGGLAFTFANVLSPIHGIYGKCDSSEDTNPDCGDCCDPPNCNCNKKIHLAFSETSAGHSNSGLDIQLRNCPDTDGDNPTYYGGPIPTCACESEFCADGIKPCEDCPSPFPAIELYIPSCRDPGWPNDEPLVCKGFTYWRWSTVVCA